ncbi:uncharacterized protein (DUF2336 family) [Bradyrhizobium ottawaense]
MTVATSLIPGLDDIVKRGDPRRRGEIARAISELFFQDSANLRPELIDLFDNLLIDLVPHAELASRVDLAERFSHLNNAPPHLVNQLARENEIMVAGPVLRRSPVLDDAALVEIARLKGQGHLLAMTERPALSPVITDVLVERGDRDVVRRAAGNAGAVFSPGSYSELIKRAAQDGVLTLKIGQRRDLSGENLKQLLDGTLDVIRRRLSSVVNPARQVEIKRAMVAIEEAALPPGPRRDFSAAQRTVLALHREGHLGESALLGFAKANKYEESIASLSAMSGVRLSVLDRLIAGDRYDPILILGRVLNLGWPTVRALILLWYGPPPHAGRCRYRGRTRQLHAPDADDRRARRQFLAQPADDLESSESQIRRLPSFARGLSAVARHGVARPLLSEVVGALGKPDEILRTRKMRQRPGAVIVDVADEAEFAVRLQHARHRGDGPVLDEAPFPVPPLRPGIGMDQVDPRQRCLGQPGQQLGGIACEQTDVADVGGLDLREDLGHAVDIGLAADEACRGEALCLGRQMLAAAEADLEPHVFGRRAKDLACIRRRLTVDVERQMRQQLTNQLGLVLPELVTLAAPEERALAVIAIGV